MIDTLPMVLGLTPFEIPNPYLVRNLHQAGALGILDIGRDEASRRRALQRLEGWKVEGFGVRIPEGVTIEKSFLPPSVKVVVVEANIDFKDFLDRVVLVQVTSVEEAESAQRGGAHGLIARGAESGGRIGEKTSFVLMQQLMLSVKLPLWVQGGIGIHSAAACITGGARGVVLDSQLALLRESRLNADVKRIISGMNGTETSLIDGYRVFNRPGKDLARDRASCTSAQDVIVRLGGSDPSVEYIPVGQDGSFAKQFADEYVTAQGVVRALYHAVADHRRLARELKPLGPGAPLAESYGIEYPIFQGPMSRVTDNPEFALKVAEAGGVPFIALFVLSPDEIRSLMIKTREMLGERPFGVGLLGFLPPEIFKQQVKVLEEIKPTAAIIGGGRPAQARLIESMGIQAYLHVPSAGLLDMYLKAGVRKFIFEGCECGGHVGMLSSFMLWEQQIGQLLKNDTIKDMHVLFAGGIHDARSAAMAATMGAPLAARGCRIGALLGTGYLFTREAVTSGAIQSEFQKVAIACKETVEIESSPGHVTRVAANSDYPHFFAMTKARLLQESPDRKTVWESLEELNIGRLRTATKGGPREGVMLSPAEQHKEGSYMIGQLSALRDKTCTVRKFHQDVAQGGSKFLAAMKIAEYRETPVEQASAFGPVDIAIVGMACIYPDSADIEGFWSNIISNRNSIIEVPDDRWNKEEYFNPKEGRTTLSGVKTPSKWGGFIPDTYFDPLAYGIPPNSLTSIDPVQLLSLEVAARALQHAGYMDRDFDRSRASIFFGAESGPELAGSYGLRTAFQSFFGPLPAELDAVLPKLTEDSFPGILANIVSGRISNRLNLGGTNFVVDAACASSFAALHMSVKELVTGSADMVLCGGADLHNSLNDFLLFSSAHALSSRDRCSPFDAETEGTILGEGIACVVLKRLADAERDGDRIFAVIKGVGSSSDGRSRGLTAPTKEGQCLAMRRAYEQAGIKPSMVELLEAHGTGTIVGDTIELASADEQFQESGARPGTCTFGSVKSQIGHTKCAAGMAGLIKAALSLQRGVQPPTNNISKPLPSYNPATSPFVFRDKASPWLSEERYAGVSAFGFGGTNFHIVLSGYDGAEKPAVALHQWPAELFLFRGATKKDALAKISQFEASLQKSTRFRLRDLSKMVVSEKGHPVQVAVVANDMADLYVKLAKALQGTADPEGVFFAGEQAPVAPQKMAFLYPGQGSQRPGMLQELFAAFPSMHELLLSAGSVLDADFYERLFPPLAFSKEDKDRNEARVKDTRTAQPALAICDLALASLFNSLNIRPDMHAGHSFGEVVALCAAGAIPKNAVVGLSKSRADFILESIKGEAGGMAAVFTSAEAITTALGGEEGLAKLGIVIANFNSPTQTVISGPSAAVSQAISQLAAKGITGRTIPVACAFHSPIVKDAVELFHKALVETAIYPPAADVWSNLTAEPYPSDPQEIRRLLADQIGNAVRFVDQIRSMYAAGARIFVEVGPGNVLTKLVKDILKDQPHKVIARDAKSDWNIKGFLCAVAELSVLGVPVDAVKLFEHRDAVRLDAQRISETLSPPKSTWIINGQRAWPMSMGTQSPQKMQLDGRKFFTVESPPPAVSAEQVARQPSAFVPSLDGGGQAMVTYLRIMRELIAAQKEVMLGYLGQAPQAQLSAIPDLQPAASVVSPLREQNAPPVPETTATVSPQPSVEAPQQAPQTQEPVRESGSIMDILVAIISDRTGYPVDMLNDSIDLEADLSIDSIKRIEILGELYQRLNLGVDTGEGREDAIEALVRLRTIGEIVEWIEQHLPAASAPAEVPPAPPEPSVSATREPPAAPAAETTVKPEVNLREVLVAIISDRTGYPADMLNDAIDLEADLSIDSIKRIEILGELYQQLNMGVDAGESREDAIEALVRLRTIGEIVEWIEQHLPAASAPAEVPPVPPEPSVSATREPPAAPAAEKTAVPDVNLQEVLVAIISDRTGYPADMLNDSIDLEADLSIDSIKRIEILGELYQQLNMGVDAGEESREDAIEALVRLRTIGEIVEWIKEHQAAAPASAAAPPAPPESPVSATGEPPPAAPAAEKTAMPEVNLREVLVDIISDRTGYPADMLNDSIDLEADLSIDSIKRIEILGELYQQLNMGVDAGEESREDAIEALVRLRTIGEIVEWIEQRTAAGASASQAGGPDTTTGAASAAAGTAHSVSRLVYRLQEQPAPAGDGLNLGGKEFLVTDDGRGIAPILAQRIEKAGAKVQIVKNGKVPSLGTVNGVIHLASLSPGITPDAAKDAFLLVKNAVGNGVSFVLAATGLGGKFGERAAADSPDDPVPAGGIGGMMKTLAHEKPGVSVRAVDVDPGERPDAIAESLFNGFFGGDGDIVEVGYAKSKRFIRTIIGQPIDGTGNLRTPVTLGRDSVVLLTGGARGITALAAVALARRVQGIRIELAGRTPRMTREELAPFVDCHDRISMRKAIIARGVRDPGVIESDSVRILRAREIEKTMADLAAAGAVAQYHPVDVGNQPEFERLIDRLYADYGKIDGVVHGAGILEDKLLEDKTPESFARVFDTKVKAAMVLAGKLRNDVQFVTFFSSISAVFGNRGQIDYSAANDALDQIARWLNRRIAGRAFSISWGPWRSLGMVSPELEREYAKRGVGLIEPQDGVEALLHEIFNDRSKCDQVILMVQNAASSSVSNPGEV